MGLAEMGVDELLAQSPQVAGVWCQACGPGRLKKGGGGRLTTRRPAVELSINYGPTTPAAETLEAMNTRVGIPPNSTQHQNAKILSTAATQ